MGQCVRPKTNGTARTGPFFDGCVLRLEAKLSPEGVPGANLEVYGGVLIRFRAS